MILRIPRYENMAKTHQEDPVDLYYNWLTKWVYLHRFKMAVRLMRNGYHSMLDIGFGSGIFLKELSYRCKELYGIDIHENIDKVESMTKKENFGATLVRGSLFDIPFESERFDAVVSMSVLEHLQPHELPRAVSEIRRVGKKGADVILGFPVKNLVTDGLFHILGFAPEDIHPSSHKDILSVIKKYFHRASVHQFPTLVPRDLSLYVMCRCER